MRQRNTAAGPVSVGGRVWDNQGRRGSGLACLEISQTGASSGHAIQLNKGCGGCCSLFAAQSLVSASPNPSPAVANSSMNVSGPALCMRLILVWLGRLPPPSLLKPLNFWLGSSPCLGHTTRTLPQKLPASCHGALLLGGWPPWHPEQPLHTGPAPCRLQMPPSKPLPATRVLWIPRVWTLCLT